MPGWMMAATRIRRAIWFRAALFTLGGVALALLAPLLGSLLPTISIDLGQNAVSPILQILATSMLTVTTFSTTIMVSSLAGAASTTTPRVVMLMASDRTTQTVLSTFLGAFAFAIVGLVALATQFYSDTARIVLFLGSLLVIVIVVVSLLRWIGYLTRFGRLGDVLDRVESRADASLTAFARRPRLGGAPVPPGPAPTGATPAASGRSGFVTNIDLARAQAWATQHDRTLRVVAMPGDLVDAVSTLVLVEPGADRDDDVAALVECWSIEPRRTYDQDPRLGLVALSEIGSRALSPAVNDPGTAMDALASVHRVLQHALDATPDASVDHDRVQVPVIELHQFLDDGFGAMGRDGAGLVEVATRLQRILGMLASHATGDDREWLRDASSEAEARSLAVMTNGRDRERVTAAAAAARREG